MTYDERPWLKHYDPGVEPDIDIPAMTVVERLEGVARRFPDNPALHFYGRTLTYRELVVAADRFARCLSDNGLRKGDVVGICLPNIPQFVIALMGVVRAGCSISGVSPLMTQPELEYQLRDCSAKALVTLDAIFEHRFQAIASRLPDLRLAISTGILDFMPWIKRVLGRLLKKVPTGKVSPLAGKTVLHFRDILSRYPAQPPDVAISPDDVCLVQYTGGTTGLPKGTILTHRNLVANLTQLLHWVKPEPGKEVFLSGFPMFHLAGFALAGVALAIGGVQILIPNPRDTAHIVEEMARYRPTIMVNVPSLYMILLEEPGFRKLDFSRVSFCLSGASPFPVESIRELERVVGEGRVLEVYGMTETSPIVTMNPHIGKKKVGTVGLPVSSTRVRLMDLETGSTEVPLGGEGEIVVAGPQVMQGYLNRPEETALALRNHDGEIWLHTGDVARMDQDGFFTVVDRAKDMLNVGGFKVFSREVEEKLYEHPGIEFCAIVGIPNPKRPGSELVKLVVQPTESHRADPEKLKQDILDFSRQHFAPYKVPKFIELTDSMPLTPVGKVDKKRLRKAEEQ